MATTATDALGRMERRFTITITRHMVCKAKTLQQC